MPSGAGLTIVVAVLMLPFAGPAFAQAKGDYVLQCQREIRPKGYYTYDAGQRLPVVVPEQGGTQVEADALNACIRAKAYGKTAAATMMTPVPESSAGPVGGIAATAQDKPRYTRKQRGAALLSGGSGYRGAYLEGGIGVHLLSATSLGSKRFSTALQFGEHLGFGYRFGARGAFDLGYRYQHVSNADIKHPNSGIEFNQVRLQYWFD